MAGHSGTAYRKGQQRLRPVLQHVPTGPYSTIRQAHGEGSWIDLLRGLGRIQLLVIDDWLRDPEQNIALGTWYLQYLVERFGVMDIALIAYNAGPSNAERWHGQLDLAYQETRIYVRRVMSAIPIYRLLLAAPWRQARVPRNTPSVENAFPLR